MTHRTPAPRSVRAALWIGGLTAIAALGGVLTSTPAHAADAYRYWTYWNAAPGAAWTYAQTGSDAVTPADGAVEGWRFEVAGEATETLRAPRIGPDFTAICAATAPAPSGQKRVGVVLDFGTSADSGDGATPPEPTAECVTVPANATGTQVLAAAATVRAQDGLTCAIDGYPAAGCGDVVANATLPPTGEPTLPVPGAASASAAADQAADAGTGSSTPWGAIVGVVVIVVIGLIAFAVSRRSRG